MGLALRKLAVNANRTVTLTLDFVVDSRPDGVVGGAVLIVVCRA